MLRLTLRTLLAYLDDTLPPSQARDIGKKVAESEVAQQTVERIKTVTRRRRLSAPRVEPDDHSTDPNVIAEYLDNVLPSDDVTDLETAALENDTRLAEVAACHQILTLVLGEPARVPPAARRRMYKLVTGPESIPSRKPTEAPVAGVAAPQAVDEFHDEDLLESLLGPRNVLWMVALLVAVGLLAVSIYFAIPPAPPPVTQGYVAVAPAPKPEVKPKVPDAPPVKVPDPPPGPKVEAEALAIMPREVGAAVAPPPVQPPDVERRALAAWNATGYPPLFLRRETTQWVKAAAADAKLATTDTILALPGFRLELALDTGVRLVLWGNSPDVLPLPLAESRVTLFVPPPAVGADLALHAGRVFLAAPTATGPTTVRLRIRDEVWDVILADGRAEVAIDVVAQPAPGSLSGAGFQESPRTLVYLGVLGGTASVRAGFTNLNNLPTGAKVKWDSKAGRPALAPMDDKDDVAGDRWRRDPAATPAAKEGAAAVADLAKMVAMSEGPFDVLFDAIVKDQADRPARRTLAAWMLGAVDGVSYLIDALEANAAPVRDAAARALVHWAAQAPEREAELTRVLETKMAIGESQRPTVVALVRSAIGPGADTETLFLLLRSERLSLRELARLQLAQIDPVGARESRYDAAADARDTQAQAWQRSWAKRIPKPKVG
ncbi:MAG TPA: hypothetical protein VM597_40100 [Gemmataceae bacterium]|jgi:hypothetical protein|nr:hypothetical protein [Gemmataceae bacterium]